MIDCFFCVNLSFYNPSAIIFISHLVQLMRMMFSINPVIGSPIDWSVRTE